MAPTETTSSPIVIDYYSDILCVWAWISQQRINKLNENWGSKIIWRYHYVDIFGDTQHKMKTQWKDKGGYSGFAKHVIDSAHSYDLDEVSPHLWTAIQPASSAQVHQAIKGIEILLGAPAAIKFAEAVRHAFFVEGLDISLISVLNEVIEHTFSDSHDTSNVIFELKQLFDNGQSIAALMQDYQKAKVEGIKGSPTYVLNNGRQNLYGNVGFRVLNANIEELLKKPINEASWC
jgi:predicted DsbA family dithiol-disulfide isomerase